MSAMLRKERGGGRVYFVTLSRKAWRAALLAAIIAAAAFALWRGAGREDASQPVPSVREEPAAEPAAPVDPTLPAEPEGTVAATDTDFLTGSEEAVPATAAPSTSHPFDRIRWERERMRSREAELLQATAQDPSVGEDRRREAHEELLALWRLEALELEIEHLIQAQGYDGVVVLTPNGAHVVVDGVLDAGAAALIGELTHRVSGVRREAVTIVDGVTSGM